MKSVDVKDQVRLPLSRCAELVLSGVKFRLFRAAITVAIISLAVAFLMTMLSESLIALRVASAVREQTAPRRELQFWVSRLSAPLGEGRLSAELAAADLAGERRKEFKAWGQLSDEDVNRLAEVARREQAYLAFFASLGAGDRAQLVGRARKAEIFRHLQDPGRLAAFESKRRQLGKSLPAGAPGASGGPGEAFAAFLKDWQATEPMRQAILAGHERRLEKVQALLTRKAAGTGRKLTPEELLASEDPGIPDELAACDMFIAPGRLATVRRQAKLSLDAQHIEDLLGFTVVKQRLAERQNAQVADVNAQMLYEEIHSSSGAEWLEALVESQRKRLAALRAKQAPGREIPSDERSLLAAAKSLEAFDLDSARLQEVARDRLEANNLSEVEAGVSPTAGQGGWQGFSARTLALLAVSFVVCIVGIANAMLMSVTERFREIATMKCLGATDGFIMVNFILESCLQGVAGGVLGVLLGFVLGVLRASATYGWLAMTHLPGWQILAVAGLSIVAGVVISALAAVYPAWAAARLAPMEAMRIE